MQAEVFARHLISVLVIRLARLPWLISAAQCDEPSKKLLETILGGGEVQQSEDELFGRIGYPWHSIAALAACYKRPDFDTMETLFSRLHFSAELSQPALLTEEAFAQVLEEAHRLRVYQLRYQCTPSNADQAARKLGILRDGEWLSTVEEHELLERIVRLRETATMEIFAA